MANRAMNASELAEYYTLAAAAMLAKMNRGYDVTTVSAGEVPQLVVMSVWRAKIKALDPSTLLIDDATFVPTEETITALS